MANRSSDRTPPLPPHRPPVRGGRSRIHCRHRCRVPRPRACASARIAPPGAARFPNLRGAVAGARPSSSASQLALRAARRALRRPTSTFRSCAICVSVSRSSCIMSLLDECDQRRIAAAAFHRRARPSSCRRSAASTSRARLRRRCPTFPTSSAIPTSCAAPACRMDFLIPAISPT